VNQSNTERYIGLVKWFHDHAKNANYGFIQHAKLGDLFFHERSIERGQDLNSFSENAIVVFIAQESSKHKGKLEAVGVKYLETETDLNFLFIHFLSMLTERGKYSDYNTIQKGVHLKITSLLEKKTDNKLVDNLFEGFENFIITKFQTESIIEEDSIKGLFKVCKSFFPDNFKKIANIIERKISPEFAHKLWLEGYFEICPIDYIADNILSATQEEKRIIFTKCSEEDKSNIFFKVLYSFENINNEAQLLIIKEFLKLSKEFASEQHEKILSATIKVCPDYFKLNLWLEDYHDTLDFNSYKLYTITLSPANQKRFVKKVLKSIHEGKANISIDELTSLNVIDYETSKYSEEIDEARLDYSTSIILNVISELQNQTKLETRKETNSAQYRIYDLVIKQIKEPNDILQITGYFDECGGRCNITVFEEKNEEGKVIARNVKYQRNEHQKSIKHPICDGRKAVNTVTKEPLLSEEKLEYWWCANQKCFKPSRKLHNSTEWEKYSLLDFLTILKVDFKETDLEIYLNIINKANRFLKHLKCRECNHILYPKGKTQYAFYGVSNFSCKTETCSEKGKEIYLSHCLNGYCEMEIDSRDCVKCKPPGHDAESCGWYVCNFCHSCCSGQQLERRKYVYDTILHKEYKCHIKGHRDLGIISCNKCGDSMESNEIDITEYERFLNWFIANKDTSDRIFKSGKNKFNKWWFVIKRGNENYEAFKEKLKKYYKIGFQIPDFDKDKDLQLISEPIDFKKHNDEILICKNCDNTIALSNDNEKARAIKQFHYIKFSREAAKK